MDLFTVVLREDVAVDARRYGDLLAPLVGITRIEAKMLMRKGRGILVEDVPEEAARRIHEELGRDGFKAWCVPNDRMPPVPAPRRVTWTQFSPAALRFRWPEDDLPLELYWNRIGVVSVGLVAQEEWRDTGDMGRLHAIPSMTALGDDPETRAIMRENLILKVNAGPKPPSRPKGDPTSVFERISADYHRQLKVVLDVVDADRTSWLRMPMDELSYGRDEKGMRFGDAFAVNFLVGDLLSRAPGTATEATLRLTNDADIKELVFLTIEEFNRYTTWHVLKRELACADSSSPSPEPPAPSTDGGSSNASSGPGAPSISP